MVERPTKSSAIIRLSQRRVACRPSELTGSKLGSDDEGGGTCTLPLSVDSMSSSCPGGGPVNSTHLMATLAFQRGIPGGMLGEGAAIAVSMIPFLVFATLFSYFALARRKWQQGESND